MKTIICKLMLLFLFSISTIHAITLHVSSTNDSGVGSLRDAIQNSTANDSIVFDISGTIELISEILINKSISIIGSNRENLILSGRNTNRIFMINDADVNISNMTIRDGNITGADSMNNKYSGGAIKIEEASRVIIENTNFYNNYSNGGGGAIEARELPKSAHLTIKNCNFENNSADRSGGAINFVGVSLSIEDSSFSENRSTMTGGAIRSYHAIAVSNTTFTSNTAEDSGGAIALNDAPGDFDEVVEVSSLSRCNFIQNVSKRYDKSGVAHRGGGGAISAIWNVVHINESLFYNNEAHNDGGAIAIGSSRSYPQHKNIIKNSTFSQNWADDNGGAIYYDYPPDDADIYAMEITHSTIYKNIAGVLEDINNDNGFGGGIYSPSRNILIRNTILTENKENTLGNNDCRTAQIISGGYNTVSATGSCTFSHATDRMIAIPLELLADNGGPTKTLALPEGSPAIDTGVCSDIDGNQITVDQRNIKRGTENCDVGAFELLEHNEFFPALFYLIF